jgi:hypothetical protein
LLWGRRRQEAAGDGTVWEREEEIPNQYVLNVKLNERNDDSHATCNVLTGTNMQGDTASSADKSTEGED